jgi:hypothetical protein
MERRTKKKKRGEVLCSTYVETLDFHDVDSSCRLLTPDDMVVPVIVAISASTFRGRNDGRWWRLDPHWRCDGKSSRQRVLQLVLVLQVLVLLRAAPRQRETLTPGHVWPRWRIVISIVHRFLQHKTQGRTNIYK